MSSRLVKNPYTVKKMFSTILTCFCLFKSGWGIICLCTVCLVCGISVHLACGTSVCLVCGISVCSACGIRVCPMDGIFKLRPGSKLWKHLHVAALLFHSRVIQFSRIFKVFIRVKFMKAGIVAFKNKVNTEYPYTPLLPLTLDCLLSNMTFTCLIVTGIEISTQLLT